MVCRSRPGGSASTSYAQQITRLPANAVLSLSHQLRHEGSGARNPTHAEVQEWVEATAGRVLTETSLSEARRASIAERLRAVVSDGEVSGTEFYSWQNIVNRAIESSRSIDAHIRNLTRRLNMTEDEVMRRAGYERKA